jgi:hypothetical protein
MTSGVSSAARDGAPTPIVIAARHVWTSRFSRTECVGRGIRPSDQAAQTMRSDGLPFT